MTSPYPEVKTFVQGTLGCACPEEVFDRIAVYSDAGEVSHRMNKRLQRSGDPSQSNWDGDLAFEYFPRCGDRGLPAGRFSVPAMRGNLTNVVGT